MSLPLPAARHRRHALIGTALSASLLAALTVAVASGATDSLDVWARDTFRPDLMWGANQQRANHVVFWLSPQRMVLVLALGSAGVAAWRVTVWPLVQSALAVAAATGLTFLLKVLVDRADPKGQVSGMTGSFPSGHSAILLVSVATGAMLIHCPTRWWERVGFVALELALALAMMYVALHWLTDIVGGALVAAVVLGVEALVAGPDGGPSHRGRRHRLRFVRRLEDRSPDRSVV